MFTTSPMAPEEINLLISLLTGEYRSTWQTHLGCWCQQNRRMFIGIEETENKNQYCPPQHNNHSNTLFFGSDCRILYQYSQMHVVGAARVANCNAICFCYSHRFLEKQVVPKPRKGNRRCAVIPY